MKVDRLVRLHDSPPFAPLVAQDEVHRAAALDGGSAHRGDQLGEPGEPLRRALVGEAGRVAHHPGGLGLGVPELEAALAGRDLFTPNRYRAATGELRPRSRSPRRFRKGRGFLDLHREPPCHGPDPWSRIQGRSSSPEARSRSTTGFGGGETRARPCPNPRAHPRTGRDAFGPVWPGRGRFGRGWLGPAERGPGPRRVDRWTGPGAAYSTSRVVRPPAGGDYGPRRDSSTLVIAEIVQSHPAAARLRHSRVAGSRFRASPTSNQASAFTASIGGNCDP